MSIQPHGMSIQSLYRLYREEKLIVNRKYQRKLVWSLEEKQGLIDSLTKNYPIPLILLAKTDDGVKLIYEIMDGVQRLNAIFSFIENKLSLENKYFDITQFATAKIMADKGMFVPVTHEDNEFLTPEKCSEFLDYQLAVTQFTSQSEFEITDIFGRINSGGRQLSNQERRQAGTIDDFTTLVREISSEIRGDVSKTLLSLTDMPQISVNSNRHDLGYQVIVEKIFWVNQGILNFANLRDSEDEEIIVDLCASIASGQPIAFNKKLLDNYYDSTTTDSIQLKRSISLYGVEKLKSEINITLSVLIGVITDYNDAPYTFRNTVNPDSGNKTTSSFYTVFMAFHKLVIQDEKKPHDSTAIMKALDSLQGDLKSSGSYATIENRIKNIDGTIGLIQKYFSESTLKETGHGAGVSLDFENAISRSKIETSRYEYKQGLCSLVGSRDLNAKLLLKLGEIIVGIANVSPEMDGYIFIGVADTKNDSEKISEIDNIEPIKIGNHYVVGVDREVSNLGYDLEAYMDKILASVSSSGMSDPLKSNILSKIDCITYKTMSIVRITIVKQNELSSIDGKYYIRENSKTILIDGAKLLAASKVFST